jgi:hypothetical protein
MVIVIEIGLRFPRSCIPQYSLTSISEISEISEIREIREIPRHRGMRLTK